MSGLQFALAILAGVAIKEIRDHFLPRGLGWDLLGLGACVLAGALLSTME